MKNNFVTFVKISLILVYLVIAAGAIVRMTGSGMGCPDWPKCFGYWIPPTERAQLDWKIDHFYEKEKVIIVDESLRVAKQDFTSSNQFNPNNWDLYTQHSYALFNPYHTWIEYINRLIGALAGLATLLLAVTSLWSWKKNKPITLISFAIVLGMGFQAWLGKVVVDSNLTPHKISIHMGMALLIVLGLVILLFINSEKTNRIEISPFIKYISFGAILLTLFQIGLGTQVRQYVDLKMHISSSGWLDQAPIKFYIHRSLSLLVVGIHLYLLFKLRQLKINIRVFNTILFLIILEIITGILMYYFDFPFSSQPLHLIIASLLFGVQSFFILQLNFKNRHDNL